MQNDWAGHFTGNVTREPELRFLNDGTAVANFGLAANHSRKASDGDGYEETGVTYMDVTCWEDLAMNVSESVHVGDRVTVYGAFETEAYEKRNGEGTGTSLKVRRADDVALSLRFHTGGVEKAEIGRGKGERQRTGGQQRSNGRQGGQQRSNGRSNGGGRPQASRRDSNDRPQYDYDEEPF